MKRPLVLVALILFAATPSAANTIVVSPGDSIQAAIDVATAGDTVIVNGGSYQESGRPCPSDASKTCAVVVDKANLKLISPTCGRDNKPCDFVSLTNPGGQQRGIEVAPDGANPATCDTDLSQRLKGFTLQGFALSSFDEVGISLVCVDGFRIKRTTSHVNGVTGVRVDHATRGRIHGSGAGGNGHSGFLFRESDGMKLERILNSGGNTCGIDIENSSHVGCTFCNLNGNSVGMLIATLPGGVRSADRNLVTRGFLVGAAVAGCTDANDACCNVPPGVGVLVAGADRTKIVKSTVQQNGSAGIRVASYCTTFGLTPTDCGALTIDPNPDGTHIVGNQLTGNGLTPDPVASAWAADLSWDGSGLHNCWNANTASTESPPGLSCN